MVREFPVSPHGAPYDVFVRRCLASARTSSRTPSVEFVIPCSVHKAEQTHRNPPLQGVTMATSASAGARFRAALAAENPLQIVGTVNAYSAILAQASGFRAIYLSGAGVANASLGLPDLAITTLNDVL